MTTLAAPAPARVTREQLLAVVDRGVFAADDRVELLEGVLDLRNRRVQVHRSPDRRHRRHRVVEVAAPGARIAPVAFPDVSVAVGDLLP